MHLKSYLFTLQMQGDAGARNDIVVCVCAETTHVVKMIFLVETRREISNFSLRHECTNTSSIQTNRLSVNYPSTSVAALR